MIINFIADLETMKTSLILNFGLFIVLAIAVVSYLPIKETVLEEEVKKTNPGLKGNSLEKTQKTKPEQSSKETNIIANNSRKINSSVFIVALVLEWYPIDNGSTRDSAWAFQNFFLWLKEGGFKVVPIFPWHTKDQVKRILGMVNSVAWMGGMQNFDDDADGIVEDFYKMIFEEVKERKLPLFAVCQGFQLVLNLSSGKNVLSPFANDKGMFQKDSFTEADSNRDKVLNDNLFTYFNKQSIQAFEQEPTNFHFHKYGISPKNFKNNEKFNSFHISSVGKDANDKEFVNSIYHKDLPINAVQFHPEVGNSLVYKQNRGENYKDSRLVSFMILKGWKEIIRNRAPELTEAVDDQQLEELYELSTLPLVMTDEYDTGKSTIKGYMFEKSQYPYRIK